MTVTGRHRGYRDHLNGPRPCPHGPLGLGKRERSTRNAHSWEWHWVRCLEGVGHGILRAWNVGVASRLGETSPGRVVPEIQRGSRTKLLKPEVKNALGSSTALREACAISTLAKQSKQTCLRDYYETVCLNCLIICVTAFMCF